eukprot:7803167-Alexandrium_andersonii.AAC.1
MAWNCLRTPKANYFCQELAKTEGSGSRQSAPPKSALRASRHTRVVLEEICALELAAETGLI